MSYKYGIQNEVHLNVERRGYLAGRTSEDIIRRQVLKSLEELGEVARCVFDGEIPPVEELADVVIPMLVIASETGEDLIQTILDKSTSDIERGIRNG